MAPPPPPKKKETQTLERVAVRDGENQFEVTPFAFYFEGLEVHWDVTSALPEDFTSVVEKTYNYYL